jgi:hypothetical protein
MRFVRSFKFHSVVPSSVGITIFRDMDIVHCNLELGETANYEFSSYLPTFQPDNSLAIALSAHGSSKLGLNY